MDQEEKEVLKKTLELVEENNQMLHGIRRSMFWGRIVKTIYWAFIIGAAVGIYYYITPYLDTAVNAYGNFKGDLKSFSNMLKPN